MNFYFIGKDIFSQIEAYPLTYPNNTPLYHVHSVENIIFAAVQASGIFACRDRHKCLS